MADKINDLIHFLARLPECSAGNLAYLTARTALPEICQSIVRLLGHTVIARRHLPPRRSEQGL